MGQPRFVPDSLVCAPLLQCSPICPASFVWLAQSAGSALVLEPLSHRAARSRSLLLLTTKLLSQSPHLFTCSPVTPCIDAAAWCSESAMALDVLEAYLPDVFPDRPRLDLLQRPLAIRLNDDDLTPIGYLVVFQSPYRCIECELLGIIGTLYSPFFVGIARRVAPSTKETHDFGRVAILDPHRPPIATCAVTIAGIRKDRDVPIFLDHGLCGRRRSVEELDFDIDTANLSWF